MYASFVKKLTFRGFPCFEKRWRVRLRGVQWFFHMRCCSVGKTIWRKRNYLLLKNIYLFFNSIKITFLFVYHNEAFNDMLYLPSTHVRNKHTFCGLLFYCFGLWGYKSLKKRCTSFLSSLFSVFYLLFFIYVLFIFRNLHFREISYEFEKVCMLQRSFSVQNWSYTIFVAVLSWGRCGNYHNFLHKQG